MKVQYITEYLLFYSYIWLLASVVIYVKHRKTDVPHGSEKVNV